MRKFTDNAGTEWSVSVTVMTVKRVRDLAGADLLDTGDEKEKGSGIFARLAMDAILLADVLAAVVQPQLDERKVTKDSFFDLLSGDAIDAATTALLEELADFYPPPRRRALQAALGKIRAAEARAMDLAEQKISALEIDMEAEFDAALKRTGVPSGSTPESSG